MRFQSLMSNIAKIFAIVHVCNILCKFSKYLSTTTVEKTDFELCLLSVSLISRAKVQKNCTCQNFILPLSRKKQNCKKKVAFENLLANRL